MATVKLPFQNPHVSLVNDEVLDINYRNRKFKVAIANISRIYLSKRKTGYLSALFGNLIVARNTGFKLYIHTRETNTITLDIASDDKFFFVSLITWVRTQIKDAASAAPTKRALPKSKQVRAAVAA
ncbi:MAG TPA: hypothetical protein VF676_12870 [Flavobacterium sp.]|jgi:hypothetical protein